eukprot:15099733-Alexandrium_andersonii.AAC.1
MATQRGRPSTRVRSSGMIGSQCSTASPSTRSSWSGSTASSRVWMPLRLWCGLWPIGAWSARSWSPSCLAFVTRPLGRT